MKTHIESVHEIKKPFKCDICEYRCSQKNDMKRHIESVHEKKEPFKCDICDQKFNRKTNMTRHVATVHGGIKQRELKLFKSSLN